MEGFLATQGVFSVIPLLHHHTYILPPKILGVNFSFWDYNQKTNPSMTCYSAQIFSLFMEQYLVLIHKYSSRFFPRQTKTRNFSVDSRRLCLRCCTLGLEEHP